MLGNPHGLPIHRAAFPEECDLPPGTYDVITAWAVFEHLRDPGEAFRVCQRLLRPSGRLVLQIPNPRSIYSRWAMQEDVPRHLYFFTPKTLRAYGARVGLRLTRVHHTTHLFGGSGRGILRLALVRATGRLDRRLLRCMVDIALGPLPALACACPLPGRRSQRSSASSSLTGSCVWRTSADKSSSSFNTSLSRHEVGQSASPPSPPESEAGPLYGLPTRRGTSPRTLRFCSSSRQQTLEPTCIRGTGRVRLPTPPPPRFAEIVTERPLG